MTDQVRLTGCRSFTKTFNKKSDTIVWSKIFENKLKSVPTPDNNINNLKLKTHSIDIQKRYLHNWNGLREREFIKTISIFLHTYFAFKVFFLNRK